MIRRIIDIIDCMDWRLTLLVLVLILLPLYFSTEPSTVDRSEEKPDIPDNRNSITAPVHTENDIFDNDADVWWVRSSRALQDYGEYTFDVFRRHPNFLTRLQQISPGFESDNVSVSTPSVLAKLRDGREIFLMRGCRPHFCPSYSGTIGIDTQSQEFYLFVESDDERTKAGYFGRDDPGVRRLLWYFANNHNNVYGLLGRDKGYNDCPGSGAKAAAKTSPNSGLAPVGK